MKIVKTYCKNCGHSEEFSKKEMVKEHITALFRTILMAAGIIFILLMIVIGPRNMVDNVTSSLMVLSSMDGNHDEFRHTAINWTKDCYPTDTLCYSEQIFDNLNNLSYVPASKIDPMQNTMETLNWGGDCKNLAMLYGAMMRSIGQDDTILCSYKFSHCINRVRLNETNYLIVDMTGPTMYMMNSSQEPWEYFVNGTYFR